MALLRKKLANCGNGLAILDCLAPVRQKVFSLRLEGDARAIRFAALFGTERKETDTDYSGWLEATLVKDRVFESKDFSYTFRAPIGMLPFTYLRVGKEKEGRSYDVKKETLSLQHVDRI